MEKSALSMGKVYISEVIYKLNPKFNNPENEISADINAVLYRTQLDNSCIANLRTTIFNEELTEDIPFFALIGVLSVFKWEGNLTKELLEQYSTNMAAILYSYTRPLVAQITAFSNMPPLHLSVMDMRGIQIIDVFASALEGE
jgi:preprotein translocase subunit SecB